MTLGDEQRFILGTTRSVAQSPACAADRAPVMDFDGRDWPSDAQLWMRWQSVRTRATGCNGGSRSGCEGRDNRLPAKEDQQKRQQVRWPPGIPVPSAVGVAPSGDSAPGRAGLAVAWLHRRPPLAGLGARPPSTRSWISLVKTSISRVSAVLVLSSCSCSVKS